MFFVTRLILVSFRYVEQFLLFSKHTHTYKTHAYTHTHTKILYLEQYLLFRTNSTLCWTISTFIWKLFFERTGTNIHTYTPRHFVLNNLYFFFERVHAHIKHTHTNILFLEQTLLFVQHFLLFCEQSLPFFSRNESYTYKTHAHTHTHWH